MSNENKPIKTNKTELWDKVKITNPEYTKAVNKGGRTFTAINAAYQIQEATKIWGPYGATWGLRNIQHSTITGLDNNHIIATVRAVLYYPEGEFEIGSSMYLQYFVKSKSYFAIEEDFVKKLETDMLTKGLSKLGFSADIFLGLYDDQRYVDSVKEVFQKEKVKEELTVKHPRFAGVVKHIQSGGDWDSVLSVFNVSEDLKEKIATFKN